MVSRKTLTPLNVTTSKLVYICVYLLVDTDSRNVLNLLFAHLSNLAKKTYLYLKNTNNLFTQKGKFFLFKSFNETEIFTFSHNIKYSTVLCLIANVWYLRAIIRPPCDVGYKNVIGLYGINELTQKEFLTSLTNKTSKNQNIWLSKISSTRKEKLLRV